MGGAPRRSRVPPPREDGAAINQAEAQRKGQRVVVGGAAPAKVADSNDERASGLVGLDTLFFRLEHSWRDHRSARHFSLNFSRTSAAAKTTEARHAE